METLLEFTEAKVGRLKYFWLKLAGGIQIS